MVDCGVPEASCSEWHGDGTAGEYDFASRLIVEAPAPPMGEARPGRHEPRWQAAAGGAAGQGTHARAPPGPQAWPAHYDAIT